MVNLWCTLIINHRRKFEDAPETLKPAIEARLLELGYDTDGNPILKEEEDTNEG